MWLPVFPIPETSAGVARLAVAVFRKPEMVLPKLDTPDVRSPRFL